MDFRPLALTACSLLFACGTASQSPPDVDSGVSDQLVDAGPACPGCSGCCVNGACKAGTGHSACGGAGDLCDQCSQNETCLAGACALTCDDTTCPSGCCSEGQCVAGTSDSLCGGGGGVCFVCSPSTQKCSQKKCTAVIQTTMRFMGRDGWTEHDCSYSKALLEPAYGEVVSRYPGCTVKRSLGPGGTYIASIDCFPTCSELCQSGVGCWTNCTEPNDCSFTPSGGCQCAWP